MPGISGSPLGILNFTHEIIYEEHRQMPKTRNRLRWKLEDNVIESKKKTTGQASCKSYYYLGERRKAEEKQKHCHLR